MCAASDLLTSPYVVPANLDTYIMVLDSRPPPNIPATLPTRPKRVEIKHPGYKPSPVLIRFDAFDLDSADPTGGWGCNHRLILDVCRIIANNRDGFLSTKKTPNGRIPESSIVAPVV